MGKMKPQPIADCRAILERLPTKYAALAALGIATGGRIAELLSLRRGDLIDRDTMDIRPEIRILKLKSRRCSTLARGLMEIKQYIADEAAPRNYRGEIINRPPPPPSKPPPKQYRRFIIPAELEHYIAAHLNADATRGYIHRDDYVFRGRNGKPLQTRAAYATFTRYLGRGYGTHWLRKTYATFMYSTFIVRYDGDAFRAAREVQLLLGHKSIDTTARYLCLDTLNRAETIRAAFSKAFSAAAATSEQPSPP